MDADYPLAGRTMDQLYATVRPEMGQERHPLPPKGERRCRTPVWIENFVLKKGGLWRGVSICGNFWH